MTAVTEGGNAVNLTASGAVSSGPCTLLGFYVNSTTSGTIVIKDGGSSGTALSGTITPAVGWHRFPAAVGASCYATLGSTIDVTFFYAP
jgi:hypothetical protein